MTFLLGATVRESMLGPRGVLHGKHSPENILPDRMKNEEEKKSNVYFSDIGVPFISLSPLENLMYVLPS